MKVGVYYNNKDVRVQEEKIPEIGDDEFLLKVESSGICGSDVMEWYRIKKAPLVLGHEVAGTIEKIGKNVKGFKLNDRVMVSHHVPCMKCEYCLNGNHTSCETLRKTNFFPGGFSQYIRIPKLNVEIGTLKLPDNVSFDEGTFVEPIGCVARGQRMIGLSRNDTLLIIGSGISGLMQIKLAKSKGLKKIFAVDINESRLEYARSYGAISINAKDDVPKKLLELNYGKLASAVIVCSGALGAAKTALICVDKGARILFFAVPKPEEKLEIPINDFWKNEIKIFTCYGAAPCDLEESLDLIASKKITVADMVSHKFPIEEIQKGFSLVAEGKVSLKVIILPNQL